MATNVTNEPPAASAAYTHGEAFCQMLYHCKQCGAYELIWNSRDGVTPFGLRCRRCGGSAMHVLWKIDNRVVNLVLQPGERFFRDGTPAEARQILEQRFAKYAADGYVAPAGAEREEVIKAALADEGGEFQPGWPMVATKEA